MARDPEKTKAAKARYRDRNREALREKGREYTRRRRQDPEVREAERKAAADWRARNPERAAEVRRTFKERQGQGYEAERMREWRAANPERDQENAREWRKRNAGRCGGYAAKRRAKIVGSAVIQLIDRDEIYDRDNGICYLCAKPVPHDAFEVDHVVPLSRGGLHIKANCKTTHVFCNRSKGNKLLTELRAVA